MFHLAYMDVYFNLPVSKNKYTNKRLIFLYVYVDNFWDWYIKVDIHVGKVKHKNNCNFIYCI